MECDKASRPENNCDEGRSFIHSLEAEGTAHHEGLYEEASRSRKQREGVEDKDKSFYCGFHRKEWAKQV